MSHETDANDAGSILIASPPAYSFSAAASLTGDGTNNAQTTSMFEKFPVGANNLKGIRLLSLLPGVLGSPIECTMQVASLYGTPDYEALSYTWLEDPSVAGLQEIEVGSINTASTEFKPVIQIGGEVFLIQRNLWWALEYLRRPDEERTLWVDAVCVDQANIQERNLQVGHMGEIYRLAKQVIVWVGREDKHSTALFNFMREPSFRKCLPSSEYRIFSGKDIRVYREAFDEFCSRSYWTRLWIVQEIGLASKIEIQCGADSARWEAFTKAGLMFRGDEKLPMRIAQQRIRRRGGSCSLDSLLKDCGESLCQDPRDKVYGLLGLVTEGQVLEVDYSKSLFDLFADLVQHKYRNTAHSATATIVPFVRHLHRMWPELHQFDEKIQRSPRLLDDYSLRGIIRGRITRITTATILSSSTNRSAAWHPKLYRDFPQESAVQSFRDMIDRLAQTPREDFERIGLMEASTSVISNRQVREFLSMWPLRIFLEEKGQFGVGPSIAKKGDFLCQFHGSDIAAILRGPPRFNYLPTAGYRIIGRAFVAKRSNEEGWALGSKQPPKTFRYSVPEESNENRKSTISLEVRLKELYLLTR